MKQFLIGALLVSAAAFAFGDGNKLGIGVDGSVYNNTQTSSGYSDYTSSTLDLRVFAVLPLSATTELDASVSVASYATKDPSGLVTTAGTDDAQSGAGAGLGYYASLATAGPFSLLSGFLAEVRYLAPYKGATQTYSYYNGHVAIPLILQADIGSSLSLRVTETILDLYGRTKVDGTTTSGFSALQFNQFGPSVGCVLRF